MLRSLRLRRYKGFADFTIRFAEKNVLIGPNNAGKSTIIEALRLVSGATALASRRNPTIAFKDPITEREVIGHPLNAIAKRDIAGFVPDNVRYLFGDAPAAIMAGFSKDASLGITWETGTADGLFYVDRFAGAVARNNAQARGCLSRIGVIPVLSPLEDREDLLTEQYIAENRGSRLSSRHFRNQLWHLLQTNKDAYRECVAYILEHTPEIADLRVVADYSTSAIDLFYVEPDSGHEMEVFWAGDGMQVWLQILYHLHRLRSMDTIILDEPDVYLHPDLQRRLIGLLEDMAAQTVVATHAPEMLTEAAKETVVWIDRKRRSASRARDEKDIDTVNTHLGSGFNLGIARALRSRVALFVEGKDMRILRNLASRAGATAFARERGLAVIPLEGFTNWANVKPFSWMAKGLLGDAVKIAVLLDRDYRGDDATYDVTRELAQIGVTCHVWGKKELESYILVPTAISRLTGLQLEEIEQLLDELCEEQRVTVESNFLAERRRAFAGSKLSEVSINKMVIPEFEQAWGKPGKKLELVPPKDVLSALNERLQGSGNKAVTARALSTAIRKDELSGELADFVLSIESMLTTQ